MDCKEIKEKLISCSGQMPESEEFASVKEHLAVCPNCRQEWEAYAGIFAGIVQVMEDSAAKASPSPHAWADIKGRIAVNPRRISTFVAIKSKVARFAKGFWLRPVWQKAVSVASVAAIIAALLITQLTVVLSPAAVIARAQEAATEVNSYHVTQTRSYADDDWVMRQEIDYVMPDRMKLVRYDDDVKSMEARYIGSNRYSWTSETGLWELDSGDWSPQSIGEMSQGLMQLGAITQIRVLPDEVVDVVSCVHYEATFNPSDPVFYVSLMREVIKVENDPDEIEFYQKEIERSEQMIAEGAEVPDETVVMNYWIGKDDYLVRQFHSVHSRQWQGKLQVATDTATYSQFNEPIEIEAPSM
ncbi:MAG: zf-HC2 domain-containing protein [Chloroflexi bacterium]|jgi:hypothetical protein|nr:zf-HC2 domain-containing protein [Chloroflexota bacterium]MBT7079902.1 zf-HC2 domain-containing protein [Chloroflexota bacterium]MBT7288878.1 zf-HC2 domain-containing protein [Chloroflexota bacterium]